MILKNLYKKKKRKEKLEIKKLMKNKKRKIDNDIRNQFQMQKDDSDMKSVIGSMVISSIQTNQMMMAKIINNDSNVINKDLEKRVDKIEKKNDVMDSKLDQILELLKNKK